LRFLNTDAARRCDEKNRPRFGASSANGGTALLDRLTAEGVLLVRSVRGVSGYHSDPVEPDIKFLCGDLGESRKDALTELGLASEYDDRVVRFEPYQPSSLRLLRRLKGRLDGAWPIADRAVHPNVATTMPSSWVKRRRDNTRSVIA
jgi:hypothetical protein